jgi:hypothetical protein
MGIKREATIHNIKSSINQITRKQMELEKKHEKEKAELEKDLSEIRKKCKHESITWFGDPAGGSDSFEECNVCGKQAKSL